MALNVPDKYGFVNDATYCTNRKKDGKQVWTCPYYRMWYDMKRRHLAKFKESVRRGYAAYMDVDVCEDWKRFSNFKAWAEMKLAQMGLNSLDNLTLDKDILVVGNRTYAPEFCSLVENRINVFFTKSDAKRGDYPIGVHWCNTKKVFVGQCKDGIRKSQIFLGYYDNPCEPHKAWQLFKAKVALRLSGEVEDELVARALVRVFDQLTYQASVGEITTTF